MEIEPRGYARAGLVYTFIEIAVDSFIETERIKSLLPSVDVDELSDEEYGSYHKAGYEELTETLRKETIKCVIFICTFLESYIYDYSATVIGDKFSKEHLDKLGTLSKWLVVTKLITGKDLDIGKSYFGEFKNLIKWRNELIHHKSIDAIKFFSIHHSPSSNDRKPIYELINTGGYFKMIRMLFTDLDNIDPEGFHTIRINRYLKRAGF